MFPSRLYAAWQYYGFSLVDRLGEELFSRTLCFSPARREGTLAPQSLSPTWLFFLLMWTSFRRLIHVTTLALMPPSKFC